MIGIQALRVRRVGVFSNADIQFTIRSEINGAAIVIGGGTERVEVQDHHFTSRQYRIRAVGKAADAVVRGAAQRVIQINKLIGGKRGVERDAQQSALAGGIYTQAYKRF